MKIGIIGAGNIGSTLAQKLAAHGHTIKLANSRGPETIAELATRIGAKAVERQEAVRDVDVIILSTPFDKHAELAPLLGGVGENVIVIDTSNYYPFRDGNQSGQSRKRLCQRNASTSGGEGVECGSGKNPTGKRCGGGFCNAHRDSCCWQ